MHLFDEKKNPDTVCSLILIFSADKAIKIILIAQRISSLPNDKILDQSKFKAFADDKIKVTQKLKFVLRRTENIAGKGENAGYQHFLLFPQCYQ